MTDWDFPAHEEFISRRGDVVIHETGVACPYCRVEDFYAGNLILEGKPVKVRSLSCEYCQGDGYIYRSARPVTGLLTSINAGSNRQLLDAGWAVPGDCVLSVPPSLQPSVYDFDKITFTHSQAVNDGQVIIRNAANLGDNKMLDTDLASNEDRLWYLPECALWCEDEDGVLYQQNTDYVFQDKKIIWGSNRPADKKSYVLKYTAFLEWMAFASPMERVDRGRSLGYKVMLRKKHVYFSTGSPADTPAKRQEEEREFTTRVKI